MATNQFSNEEIMQKVETGKPFTIMMLKSGKTAPVADEARARDLQMAHLSHLFSLEKDGSISIFGPVMNDAQYRGMIIFNTTDKTEIDRLMSTDPWIRGGYMSYELYDWFTIPGQTIRNY